MIQTLPYGQTSMWKQRYSSAFFSVIYRFSLAIVSKRLMLRTVNLARFGEFGKRGEIDVFRDMGLEFSALLLYLLA